jgi:hypothetical protein
MEINDQVRTEHGRGVVIGISPETRQVAVQLLSGSLIVLLIEEVRPVQEKILAGC